MTGTLTPDVTNDPKAKSWVAAARKDADFPIQDPFAIFRPRNTRETFRGGAGIGEHIIDLARVSSLGVFCGDAVRGFSLNGIDGEVLSVECGGGVPIVPRLNRSPTAR